MFRSEVNQTCPDCLGTGTTDEILTNDDGQVLLAPPFLKGEGDKPQFVPCPKCKGEGMRLQPAPTTVMVEGESVVLSEAERRSRFNDALA